MISSGLDFVCIRSAGADGLGVCDDDDPSRFQKSATSAISTATAASGSPITVAHPTHPGGGSRSPKRCATTRDVASPSPWLLPCAGGGGSPIERAGEGSPSASLKACS